MLLGLGGSPVFGELFLGDGVGRRVVDAAGRDKQMHDALPLSDLGRTTGISSAPSIATAASAAVIPVARRRTQLRPVSA
ncbi:hypothetical protein SSCG_05682 [Streptomyces clavuligerus]|nr:hypothetical protein SSCG_05682 [Streptomyces clavuligerus]